MPWKSLKIARCATASEPSRPWASDSASCMSTSRLGQGKPGPGSRRTRHTTSWPWAARTAATVPPTKPVAPVTAILLMRWSPDLLDPHRPALAQRAAGGEGDGGAVPRVGGADRRRAALDQVGVERRPLLAVG